MRAIVRAAAAPVCALALAVLHVGTAEAPTPAFPVTGPQAVLGEVVPAGAVVTAPPAPLPIAVRAPTSEASTGTDGPSGGLEPPATDAGRGGEPVRLELPALGVSAPVDAVGVDRTGRLDVPDDPRRVGWWADGALLPDTPQVLVGHVDSRSAPGVFARLGQVSVGDAVRVTDRDGRRATYAVTGLRQVPKDAFPTEYVYGPRPEPTLQLVTCTGRFDRSSGHYRDNLIATAVPVA